MRAYSAMINMKANNMPPHRIPKVSKPSTPLETNSDSIRLGSSLVATMGMRHMVQTGAVYRKASKADIFFMPFCSMSCVVAQRAPAAIVETRMSTSPAPTLVPSLERLCEVARPVPRQMTITTTTSLPVSCSNPSAMEKMRMKKGAADLPLVISY